MHKTPSPYEINAMQILLEVKKWQEAENQIDNKNHVVRSLDVALKRSDVVIVECNVENR